MTVTLTALLCFVAWTLALVLLVVGYRALLVLTFQRKADSWLRGTETDDPAFIKRAQNAHANCLENLLLFGGVVLVAGLSGQMGELDFLAPWLLGARIMQSTVHLIAVNHWMVFMRFNFYLVQMLILVWWILGLADLV